MIGLTIQLKDVDLLRSKVEEAPDKAIKYLGRATEAALFEVEKEAVDRNFQFKWPRQMRTGQLERSFKFGRYIHPSKLLASIGPTIHYAPHVYFGTRRGMRPNPYMDRIARAAEPNVQKHFERAVELIVNDLT